MSQLPVKRGKRLPAVPEPVGVLRERVLELAGVNLEERVRLFKLALEKLTGLLEAKEKKFFAYQGRVIDTEDVEALALQRKAALDVVELVGGETKAGEGSKDKSRAPVKVVIRKFVVNVADPKGPGSAPVVVDVTSESEFIDIPPEPVPGHSVIDSDKLSQDLRQDVTEGPDRVGPSGSPDRIRSDTPALLDR